MFFVPSKLFPKLAFRSLRTGTARRAAHRRSRLRSTLHTALYRTEQLEDRTLLSVVYPSGDVPKDISDQSTVFSTLEVPSSVIIDDINVTLDISHEKDQDLDVYLISPNGTRVELFTDVDGGGNDFSGTTLDDEAATSITTGTAPFSGTFRPEGSLATLDGQDAFGEWLLEVTDDKRRNTGTLNSWSIEINSAGPVVPSNSIDDVQQAEGDSGTTVFTFTVTLSSETTQVVTVDYATADGVTVGSSATVADNDYLVNAGKLTFLAGDTSRTISVQVNVG